MRRTTVMSRSLVQRVARSCAQAASASALVAAVATSMLGASMLQTAEDRRLREAALVLATEIGERAQSPEHIASIIEHELDETRHAGIVFAVATHAGRFVAGDPNLGSASADRCSTRAAEDLRVCGVEAAGPYRVSAAAIHTPQTTPFVLASLLAVIFSGAIAWFWSTPVARGAIAPLSRLRSRLAGVDAATCARVDLGPPEKVLEVDELRGTLSELIDRLYEALAQARRFAANAAHELRTPLTAIRAELDLMTEHPHSPADLGTGVVAVRAKANELGVLIEQLLILAAPGVAAGEPSEIVSLRDLLEDAMQGSGAKNEQRIAFPEADALVRGDEVLLATLFRSALRNALEYGARVEIGLSTHDGHAVVIIDDDGPGVDPAERERLFEPFARGREALRQRLPGHGLGLALIRHVARNHGGTAAFADKTSPGARLVIRLPQCQP